VANADDILGRASDALERARLRDARSTTGRTVGRVGRATKYSVVGITAVLLAAIVFALVIGPLGVTGILTVMLAMLAAIALGVIFSAEPKVRDTALAQTPIKALPSQTARWLDQQRALLPAPAQRLADGIGVKLEALTPQLQMLDDREPAAAEIRRLIAEELPELVRGYGRVPPALRREGLDGMAPDTQLVEGLSVVESELTRMSEQLARGDLAKLATQGKYLELKYQGEPLA